MLLYATLSKARDNQLAERQEQRTQEDHEHVTAMHRSMLEALQTQHEEVHELQAVLAALQGKPYEAEPVQRLPDLKALHPRGADRFTP